MMEPDLLHGVFAGDEPIEFGADIGHPAGNHHPADLMGGAVFITDTYHAQSGWTLRADGRHGA